MPGFSENFGWRVSFGCPAIGDSHEAITFPPYCLWHLQVWLPCNPPTKNYDALVAARARYCAEGSAPSLTSTRATRVAKECANDNLLPNLALL